MGNDLLKDINVMYEECDNDCVSCEYGTLCNVLKVTGVAYLNAMYSDDTEIQEEKDMDMAADKQNIADLEKLVERFEMSDRRLNRIRQIILNINTDGGLLKALNDIAKICGEQ